MKKSDWVLTDDELPLQDEDIIIYYKFLMDSFVLARYDEDGVWCDLEEFRPLKRPDYWQYLESP